MKIVCLLASPRPKGNSATVARRFTAKAERRGAAVHTFSLNRLTCRGCQGCMACKTRRDRCILEDDLSDVLDAVRAADAVVIATPVYWCDVTAQLKTFIDRTYSYLVPDYLTNSEPSRLPQGKKLLMIMVQGGDETLYRDIYSRHELIFQWLGFEEIQLIRACSVREQGDVNSRQDILEAAERAVDWIMSSKPA